MVSWRSAPAPQRAALFRKSREGMVLPSAANPGHSLVFQEQCVWRFPADHVCLLVETKVFSLSLPRKCQWVSVTKATCLAAVSGKASARTADRDPPHRRRPSLCPAPRPSGGHHHTLLQKGQLGALLCCTCVRDGRITYCIGACGQRGRNVFTFLYFIHCEFFWGVAIFIFLQ